MKTKDNSDIEQALTESQADLIAERFVVKSPEQHFARVKADLPQD
ncbi:MAG TPA: hypothetical protein VN226_00890 [Anaerolineales bacterium]|nr:hypothetical protein [Anaerolineales bacterium]